MNHVGKALDRHVQNARQVFNQSRNFTGKPPAEVEVFQKLTPADLADMEQKFGTDAMNVYITEMQKMSKGR